MALQPEQVEAIVADMHDQILAAQGPHTRRWSDMPRSQRDDWINAFRAAVKRLQQVARDARQEQTR